ncbi:hypothetical protein BGX38DRAFT_651311 [Terfezia claveryi]|nr:hypothetical protein BGX38DRAFT_651311 [Terfezia claveryi]
MSLRRITANISKMDILLALAAGVVMFSYFVPTVEAYNPKEQETSKRPASQQLESRRAGHMLGDYPRQRQPPITDRAIGPLADVKKEEGFENKVGNDLEEQSSCDISKEERVLVPEAELATGSLMLRSLRHRNLLQQLGVGSRARYGPRAPRQRPRHPALPPSTMHHAPLFLYNHDSRIPPTAIARSSLNEQELLQTVALIVASYLRILHRLRLQLTTPPNWRRPGIVH